MSMAINIKLILMSPCQLVSSSRVRPLATTAEALLHLARSLASHLMEGPFTLFPLSSHFVVGLPRFLFPLISPSITSFCIQRSSLTSCPKYLIAAYATLYVFEHTYISVSLHPRHYPHSPPTTHLKCINFLPLCFSHRPGLRSVQYILGTPMLWPVSLLWQACYPCLSI